jgi:hypothetical protein
MKILELKVILIKEKTENPIFLIWNAFIVVPFVFYRNTKPQEVISKIDITQQMLKSNFTGTPNRKRWKAKLILRQNITVSSNLSEN